MGRFWGEAVELFWCVVRQFNVRSVVHEEEFQLMRASFYFTHHIDSGVLQPSCALPKAALGPSH